MARGGGTGRGKLTDFGAIELIAPDGVTHYWWNALDPEGAYLENSVLAHRYPISYIYGLAPHTPNAAVTQEPATGVEVQAAALGGRIAVIYGTDRVGGDEFFGPWSGGFAGNPGNITTGFGLGEGEIDSCTKVETAAGVLVNGSPGATFTGFGGYAQYAFYSGVDAPSAADTFFTNVSTAYGNAFTERYPGLAYISQFLTFVNGVLDQYPDLRFTIKGRKLLDPRLGVDSNGIPNQPEVWSDNLMLCLADYFTNPYYGYGAPMSALNWTSVAAIATLCDVVYGTVITNASNSSPILITSAAHGRTTGDSVAIEGVLGNTAANGTWTVVVLNANTFTLTGSTGNGAYTSGGTAGRKRFTLNTTLRREASHQANIDFIRAHGRITYAKTNGLYTFYADAPAASVKVFDEVDHAVTNATNANPIVLTVPGHLRSSGDTILVVGVNGNTAANGSWMATVIDANTLSIPVAGNGAYIDGGAIVGNCRAQKRWRTPSDQIPTKVDYVWTDPSRDYQSATATDITAAAQAGTVYTRVASYNADGCRNTGQAQSQATYLLRKRGKGLFHSIICNRAEGLAMEMYDVCTLNLPSFGISGYQARIIKIAKFSNGEFEFEFEEYDSSIYGEFVAGTETKPAVTLPDPNGTPAAPPAPVVTQEGLDVKVAFSPPSPAYPYYAGTLITVQKGAGTPYNLAPPISGGPLYIRGVEMNVLYTVRAYVVSLAGVLSVAATATITPAFAQVDIEAGAGFTVNAIAFSGAKSRVQPALFGAGSWSQSGLHGYTAANVNDGNITTKAFDITNSLTTWVQLDAVTPVAFGEVTIWMNSVAYGNTLAASYIDALIPQYADVATGPFTNLTTNANLDTPGTPTGSTYPHRLTWNASTAGAHRYWRLVTPFAANPSIDIMEVQFSTFADPADGSVAGYNVYDLGPVDYASAQVSSIVPSLPPTLIRTIQANDALLALIPYHYMIDPSGTTAPATVYAKITVVTTDGRESEGRNVYTQVTPAIGSLPIGGEASLTATPPPSSGNAYTANTKYVDDADALSLKKSSNLSDVASKGASLDNITVPGVDIASATTTNIGAGTGRNINITGTTTITAFDTVAAGIERVLKFAGILTLTHNGTSLILPGAANIATAAGDVAIFESLGSGSWRCMGYTRAAIAPWNNAIATSGITDYIEWTTPTFSAGVFTGASAMTWTVDSGDVTTFEFKKVGKSLKLNVRLVTTSVGGTPNSQLQITIPNSYVSAKTLNFPAVLYKDAGGAFTAGGIAAVAAGSTTINVFKADLSAWTASTNTTQVEFSIELEIQ